MLYNTMYVLRTNRWTTTNHSLKYTTVIYCDIRIIRCGRYISCVTVHPMYFKIHSHTILWLHILEFRLKY
jgi:hypothetical protein